MKRRKESGAAQETAVRRGVGITGKLVAAVIGSVIITVSLLLAVVYVQMSHALQNKSENLIQATISQTIQETNAWINRILTMLEMRRDTIEYVDMDTASLEKYVKRSANQDSACPAGIYVGLRNGSLYHSSFVPGPEFDLFSRSWYQEGLEADHFAFGDVYFDEDSQSYVVGVSAKLSTRTGALRGVVAADVYLDAISDIVRDVQLEETGGIFLVDSQTDIIIGHQNSTMTGQKLGEIKTSEYAYAYEQIQAGRTGLSVHDNTYIQIAEVPDSSWIAVAYVSRSEVLKDLYQLSAVIAVMAIVAIALTALLVVIQIRRVIGQPVKELSRVATLIADGELEQIIQCNSRDELGVLADNFNRVTVRLREYIKYIDEIAKTLHEIAAGNLTFTLKCEYTGEFAKIKESLDDISRELNGTMWQLRAASRDVAAGAEQVSSGSITLSQGSAEQAAAVETLAKHIDSVSDSVHKIAQGAEKTNNIAQEVKAGLLESDGKMRNLTEVIQNISNKSTEINKIVKNIEDIAFQTNILALNAAVEAARAGTAGRGFAVVADEVRNLAGKSSNAAQETTVLLGQTVTFMEEGVCAAQDTVQSMMAVVDQADKMSGLISDIAEYTKQQALNTEEITHGIGEISNVVQSNVATAEASAAASEELSGQASMLSEMVARFELKDS